MALLHINYTNFVRKPFAIAPRLKTTVLESILQIV